MEVKCDEQHREAFGTCAHVAGLLASLAADPPLLTACRWLAQMSLLRDCQVGQKDGRVRQGCKACHSWLLLPLDTSECTLKGCLSRLVAAYRVTPRRGQQR